jgi:SHS family lactate transporter-like MFS transporter
MAIAFVVIPLWILVPQAALIAVGAFFMQCMVQGAWGVIPAHINELSPDRVRGFLPGFAYQVGVLIAATAPYIEAVLTHHFTYAQSMAALVTVVLVLGIAVVGAGPEAHHVTFGRDQT